MSSLDSNMESHGYDWLAYAGAAIRRLGGDDALEGERLLVLAQIEEYQGRWEDARVHFEQARPLLVKAHGVDFSRIGSIVDGLGTIALFEQRFDDARRLLSEASSFRARTTGPNSGATLVSRANEEDLLVAEGRFSEAESALHDFEKAVPLAENQRFASDLDWFWAELLHHEGRWSEALVRDQKYLGELSRLRSTNDSYGANPLAGIGKDLLGLHRAGEAVDYLERAIQLRRDSIMPETGRRAVQSRQGARRVRGGSRQSPRQGALRPRSTRTAGKGLGWHLSNRARGCPSVDLSQIGLGQ